MDPGSSRNNEDESIDALPHRDWIAALLDQKASAVEAQPVTLDRLRAETIQGELDRYKSAVALVKAPARPGTAELDRIFRLWVEK